MTGEPPRPTGGPPGLRYLEVAGIATLALGLRLVHLDVLHDPDDYFQFLAARSWLAEGTLGIAGGAPYDRASVYTSLVAAFMYVFGETMYVARLPAALAGAAWVALLFVWLRPQAGRTAAWIGAGLLWIDPGAILLSRYVRFYTLHGLVFLAAAIGVYYLATRRSVRPTSAVVALGVLGALVLAYHLQLTTVIGVLALATWLVVELGPRAARHLSRQPARSAAWSLAAGAGICLAAGAAFVHSGLAAGYWERFRSAPLWAAEHQDELGYYFRRLRSAYPVFLGLFPVAAAIAIARAGRPAVFSVVLFSVPFLLHSFAAFKAERFLSYAMPFFFATWGIAIAAVLPALIGEAKGSVARIAEVRAGGVVARIGSWALLAAMAAGLVLSTPAFRNGYALVRPGVPPPQGSRPNWTEAAPVLAGAVDSVEVVVAAHGMAAFHHLGRVDVVVGDDLMPRDAQEFVEARQIGRPVIIEAASMETLIRCHRSGLVVAWTWFWGVDHGMSDAFTAVIERHADPVPLPERWNIRAFRWHRDEAPESPEDCPAVGGGEVGSSP